MASGRKDAMGEKAKYWVAVCYPECMLKSWKEDIADILQVPFAYCVHDADQTSSGEERKEHVHIILAFPNTTTYNHVLSVYNLLSEKGKICCPTAKKIINIRHMYNYLIHDTDESRKKGKKIYDVKDRITGNNFDIGCYEQISLEEKEEILNVLEDLIYKESFTNYLAFNRYVADNYDKEYRKTIRSHSGHFDRLIRGMYHEIKEQEKKEIINEILKDPENLIM